MTPRIVVLGVGNLLLSDEGVGVRCVERLERDHALPAGVRAIDGGTSTHELLEDLEDLDALVIVDAIAGAHASGTLVRLEGDHVPSTFSNTLSPHQHGINDLLAKLALLGRAPKKVVLFGVAPESLALGLTLSPRVEAALADVCARVVDEVRALTG
ncbi:HyaD/HybD family hydrogenase maturation endopeptidase [Myxococcota bacterium]|nr:HyaD/HybD family hydrogenase maturation endopeptidase [Myxococcota bacterium]